MTQQSLLELPRPSGALPVGTVSITLERARERGERAGRFGVHIWYPGRSSRGRAPYGSGGPGLKRWLYRRLVRTHAARDAGFAVLPGRAPVLVYVAAWGGEATDNTALLEDLASHGFVVAALGDLRYDDPPIAHLSAAADLRSEAAYEATLHLARERLAFAARRVSAVLDELAALDARDPAGRFTDRLDLGRTGILGYSFGGAVAFEAARRDPRPRAVMNLDGWLFDAANGYRGGLSYFMMADRAPLPGPEDLNAADPARRYTALITLADDARQHDVLQHGGYELLIDDANHLSFCDVPLYAPLHRYRTGCDRADGIARAVRDHAVAFFRHELCGTTSPLLLPGRRTAPAMTLSRWPRRPLNTRSIQ